jgi:hypothetical protein
MWFGKEKKLTEVSGTVDRVGTSRDEVNDYPLLVLRLTENPNIFFVITKHCHTLALTSPGDDVSLMMDGNRVCTMANKTLGVEGESSY